MTAFRTACMHGLPWILYGALVLLLFSRESADDGFWWSDAPRHALNGVFLLDFFRSDGWGDPVAFAYDYYRRYPAITLPFYPPLFPLVEALFFALFGVSHAVALGTAAFFLWLGMGWACLLAARFLPFVPALAVGALFGVLPEAAFWGRQVMLDVPAATWLLASGYALVRCRQEERGGRWPLWAALFFLAACYTRQTSLFFLPVLGLGLRLGLGGWVGLGAGLLPLAAMTWGAGRVNLSSVVAGLEGGGGWLAPVGVVALALLWRFRAQLPWSRVLQGVLPLPALILAVDALGGLSPLLEPEWGIHPLDFLYYARVLPLQLGWPAAWITVLGLALAAWPRFRPRQAGWEIIAGWVVAGYLLFSLVGLKSTRFTLPILLPALLLAMIAFSRLLALRTMAALAPLLVVVTLVLAWQTRPTPQLEGYLRAAREVVTLAPRGSVILFSGLRDGAFIFHLRALGGERDLSVIRSDKLFFQVSVNRTFGLESLPGVPADVAGMRAMINRYGIRLVVFQPGFWEDLAPMARLRELLATPGFRLVARIPVTARHIGIQEKELLIYANENLPPGAVPLEQPEIPVPLADRVVPGRKLTDGMMDGGSSGAGR